MIKALDFLGLLALKEITMILDNSEWFLLGASCMLFLYFIIYYLIRRSERYNLYFAVGCLISIIRTVSYNLFEVIDHSSLYYMINVKIDYLSFIWGPFLYILLADSLFPIMGRKIVLRIFFNCGCGTERFYHFCTYQSLSRIMLYLII